MKKIYFAIAACAMFAFAACSSNGTGTGKEDTTKTMPEVKADKVDTIKTTAGKDSLYITTKADGSTDTAKAQ